MSRYLVVTWSGGGNVPPQMALSKRLLRRGHQVTVLAPRSLAEEVDATGAHFEPYRRAPEHDASRPDLDLIKDWEVRGLAARARIRDRVMIGMAAGIARDVLEIISAGRPDVLVTDYRLLGGYFAAQKEALPLAALMDTIFTLPRPGVPPFGTGWSLAHGRAGRSRDALAGRLAMRFWTAGLSQLNQVRSELGLPTIADGRALFGSVDRLLVMTSASFDFPGPIPPIARWVGVVTDPDDPLPTHEDHGGRDKRVLVSLSTTFQDQSAVLGRVIEALSSLPVRGVVTCGPAVNPTDLPAAPNVEVRTTSPHHELLPSTDLVICHGGHGTTLSALRYGVPVLCLPMGRDQGDIGARLVWRGAGMVGSAKDSPARLRQLISRALQDDSLRLGAARMATALAADDSDTSVRELEELAPAAPPAAQPMPSGGGRRALVK